jgi:hypothetical protein
MGAEIVAVQERIMALCELITLPTDNPNAGAVKHESLCSFADNELPVFVVARGPGIRHQWIDVDMLQSTREYLLKLYVQSIQDGTKPGTDEAALALAVECILPVLVFFGARRALELAIDDGGIVENAAIVQDSGDSRRFTTNSRKFSGVLFRMQVTTRHIVAGE